MKNMSFCGQVAPIGKTLSEIVHISSGKKKNNCKVYLNTLKMDQKQTDSGEDTMLGRKRWC